MTIEHRNIPDSGRHEPKGASTATIGQANISNGDGTTTFKFVDYTTILNKPSYPGFTQVLTGASSAASQLPTTTNTALLVEFGTAQSNSDASITSTGVITFLTPGQYLITRTLRYGRTALAGTAQIFTRHLINGAQSGPSSCISMDNNLDVTPHTVTILITATAGMTMSTEIIRDSSGVNVGGLYSAVPVASGWSSAPSAAVTVYKYRGAV